MKIILSLFLCLGLAQTVFAEETSEKVPVKEGYEVLDMKKVGPPADLPSSKRSKVGKAKVCVDANGKTLSPGDPGFDTCMANRTPRKTRRYSN